MGHRYLDNQNNSPLLRLPAELRAIFFRHVCDTLTLHLHENVALQDLELQRSRCQGVARPGTPRPDSVFQLQGVKSRAPLLAVCCKINEEVSEFVNDIRVTRLEKGALCTAEKIPIQCQPMTENTRILQMPIQSFWNLHNVVRGSPYSWYVVQIVSSGGCGVIFPTYRLWRCTGVSALGALVVRNTWKIQSLRSWTVLGRASEMTAWKWFSTRRSERL